MFTFQPTPSASVHLKHRSLATLLFLLIAVVSSTGTPVSAAPTSPSPFRTDETEDGSTERGSLGSPPSITSMVAELASDFRVYADGATVDIPGVSASISLTAGQSVYIYGKGTATSSTTSNLLQAIFVVCGDTYNVSTRNHEGKDVYASTNGQLTVAVRFLFTASTTGTYTCRLRTRVGGDIGPSQYLTFQSGTNTSITLSSPLSSATKWGTDLDSTDYDVGGGSYDRTVAHVGPGLPVGTSEYALRRSWEASDRTASIRVMGDVELTVCYYGTGNCPAYAYGPTSIWQAGSLVDTRLVIQQMSSTDPSTPCAITTYPTSGYLRTHVTSDAHHQKIYHHATVPFAPECGTSRRFAIKLEVKWIAYNPVRIERGAPNAGYSIGIAYNN